MLVLSRKKDQEILIGDNVKIRVLQASNGRVRLGIVADDDILIQRAEIAFEQGGGFGANAGVMVASPMDTAK